MLSMKRDGKPEGPEAGKLGSREAGKPRGWKTRV